MKKRLPVKAQAVKSRKTPTKPRQRPKMVIKSYMPWDKHWWSLGPARHTASIH